VTAIEPLDDPRPGAELGRIIRTKAALHAWYKEVYDRFADCIARTPATGIALEIGSGGGFAKQRIPGS